MALFVLLAIFGPKLSPGVVALILLIGLAQFSERWIGARASIVLTLGLCYLLMLLTGRITSSYYVMLFLPVASAATSFGLLGSGAVAIIACVEYLSFLLFVDWEHEYIPGDEQRELALRFLALLSVSYLTYLLAKAKRDEALKYQRAAEQLAAANESLKQAQAEVRRSERLAALGQLTAGLAHELRNPMGTMKTSAEMLAKSVPEDNAIAREMAGFIQEEVDRTNSLITRFLDFARPQHLKMSKGDMAALLDRVIERFERETSGAAAKVTVFKNYSPDIPPLEFDAELMERVIHNLVTNAAQASPAGGVVTVKTRRIDGQMEIAVIDRGSGIEAKDRESIFNPFFTTKAEGVGLGLAIVSKIVDEHGGQITVESEVGEGSVFHVFLPIK